MPPPQSEVQTLRPVVGSQLHDDGTHAMRVSQRIPLGQPVVRQPERSGPHARGLGVGVWPGVSAGTAGGALSESTNETRMG